MGADQQHGKPAASGGAGGNNWDRDWDVGDFLAAGFTTAVLNELLGTNSTALYSGARPLPPGIAKNLERGKALPPGIARKQPGGQLAAALPRVSGHEWLEAGTDLVLVQAGTQIVREVLRGVLR